MFFSSSRSISYRQRLPIPRLPAFLDEAVTKLLLLKVMLIYSYLTTGDGSVFLFSKVLCEVFSGILIFEFNDRE